MMALALLLPRWLPTAGFWAAVIVGLVLLVLVYVSEIEAQRLYGDLDEETVRRLLDAQRAMRRASRRQDKRPTAVRAAMGREAHGRAARRIGLGERSEDI
jgi:hypothetical protein